jgi:hypothetical protein
MNFFSQFTQWLKSRKTMQALTVSLALMLSALPAFSQLNLGRILGAVTDESGGAIAGGPAIFITRVDTRNSTVIAFAGVRVS